MTSLLGEMRSANLPRGGLWSAVLLALALAVMVGALVLALGRGAAPARDVPAGQLAGGAPSASPPASPPVPPPGGLTADGAPVLPLAAGPAGDLATLVGRPVVGSAVTVRSVAADEGFWVGTGDAERVWVQLVGDGESPYSIRAGDRVDIAATMVAHGPEYAREIGVDRGEGADLLTRQGAHLEVRQAELRPSS